MNKEQTKQAIIWLTERVAELQCQTMPPPEGEDPEKYIEDNKRDKVKRIKEILKDKLNKEKERIST